MGQKKWAKLTSSNERWSKLYLLRVFFPWPCTIERKYMKFKPFAPPLTRSLTLITCLLALHCLLCSRAHSFTCSLAQELMGKGFMSMNWMRRFHALSTHSASVWCLSKTYSLIVQSAGNVQNVQNCMAVEGLQNAPKSFFLIRYSQIRWRLQSGNLYNDAHSLV